MKRTEFIKICGLFGISLPFQAALMSCSSDDLGEVKFSGKVVIIGAGAGGLAAGYLLKQQRIDFIILEASTAFGGRMKINTTFADFPIPLGAEWLETGTTIFQEIVNDSSVPVNVETVADAPD
jgi:predicted NAD/FAD-binding protein